MSKLSKRIIRNSDKRRQAQLHLVAQDAEFAQAILTRAITAGGETLQEEFGFSVEDTTKWAKITVAMIRMGMEKDGVK